MKTRMFWLAASLMAVLSACGDDDDGGGGDTLFTGLSGVVIAAIVIYLVLRALRNRR